MTKLQEMSKSSDCGELSAFSGSGAMMRRYACLAAALVAVSAQAFNWSDYSEGADVLVTANATATDSDMATINSYSMLRFASGTTITFDISGEVSLTCPVAATGTIVKCGAGSFALTTNNLNGSMNRLRYIDFEVDEGMLKMPQESVSGDFYVRKVTVGENGTFMTCRNPNTCIEGGLWGSGVVTNTTTSASSQLRVMNVGSTPCVFSGRILGRGIRWYSGGNVHLTGTNSNFSGTFQLWNGNGDVGNKGTTGFVKIGNPGEESSIGINSDFLASREYGARMLYLGKGEATSKGYAYYNNHSGSTGAHYWDAGAYGGITFTGTWNHGSAHPERLVLMGSNTVPCVIAGAWTGDNSTRPTYVIKRGAGTWRFANNSNRTLSGVIAVEDGTIEFESIAEVGVNCSLGQATCLQSSYTASAFDETKYVDYAYLLGTTSTTGTMSFVGTSDSTSRTRPFAVKGRGCIRNAGLGGNLNLSGAFAATAAGGTLVLDAASDTTNVFSMIRDRAAGGVLSLEKTGGGTWILEGANTFSGSLAVKDGMLLVRNLPYTWFRFTVMETNGGRKKRLGTSTTNTDSNTELQELALYSADGVRRNVGMTFHTTYDDWTALPVGHACWARGGTINYYSNRNGDKIFDDAKTSPACCVVFNSTFVRLDTPSTWIPVLMHMDPDGELITMFDFSAVNAATYDRTPVAFKMDASRDGYNWEQVYCETNATPVGHGNWYSDPSEVFVAGAVRQGKGFSTSNETFAADEILPNVSAVSVAPNAVLAADGPVALKALSVDASGAGNGTVRGFAFAEAGTLRIEGLGALAGKCEIPMALEDCTGLENVSKWRLVVNGEAGDRYRAKARADGIVVTAAGTLIIMK